MEAPILIEENTKNSSELVDMTLWHSIHFQLRNYQGQLFSEKELFFPPGGWDQRTQKMKYIDSESQ